MTGERIFQILAALLAGVAAYFLWMGNIDAMFASAVVGACCFFISYRFQVKERLLNREAEYEEIDEEPETFEQESSAPSAKAEAETNNQ